MKKLNLFSNLRPRVNNIINNNKLLCKIATKYVNKKLAEVEEIAANNVKIIEAAQKQAEKDYAEFSKKRILNTLHEYNIYEYDKFINGIDNIDLPGYATRDIYYIWSLEHEINDIKRRINNCFDFDELLSLLDTYKHLKLTSYSFNASDFDVLIVDVLYDILLEEINEYYDDLSYKYIDEYFPEYNEFLEYHCLDDLPDEVQSELNYIRKIELDGSCYNIDGAVFEYLEYRKNQNTAA